METAFLRSSKPAPQDKRSPSLLIIALPASDLSKPPARVKPFRGDIGVVDFEKNRSDTPACQRAKVKIKQRAGHSAPPVRSRNGN